MYGKGKKKVNREMRTMKQRKELEKRNVEKIDWWDRDHIAGGYVGG